MLDVYKMMYGIGLRHAKAHSQLDEEKIFCRLRSKQFIMIEHKAAIII